MVVVRKTLIQAGIQKTSTHHYSEPEKRLVEHYRVADVGMWGGLMTAWVKVDKYNLEGKRN